MNPQQPQQKKGRWAIMAGILILVLPACTISALMDRGDAPLLGLALSPCASICLLLLLTILFFACRNAAFRGSHLAAFSIGATNIHTLSQKALMVNISVVFQYSHLFDDIRGNTIRMGRPAVTDDEVKAATSAAFCHEFIQRLPQRSQARIGDSGDILSGELRAEQQRVKQWSLRGAEN